MGNEQSNGHYRYPEPMEEDPRMRRLGENHRREKEELQRAFEEERRQTELKLENVINEGKQNIERLENEKKKTEQKRENELRKYENEKKKMEEKYERAVRQLRTSEVNLRKQLIEQKKSQMEMERRHYAELLDKQCVELEKERERIATVAIMKEYLKIMNTSYEAKVSLEMIKLYCLEDSSESFAAKIRFELDNLSAFREKFRDQFERFPQFLLDEPNANRTTVDACRGFISQVKDTMDHEKMLGICGVLPDALENGDQSAIRSFGADAEVLATELSNIKNGSKLQIENKDLKELTAPSTQEVFADFLKESLFQTKTVILLIIIAWILCFCR
ncbi:unnamed protein product [Caenorhabditis brenneri]